MMSAPAPSTHDNPAAGAARLLVRLGIAVLALGVPLAAIVSRRAIFLLFPIGAALILLGALLRSGSDGLRRFGASLVSPAGLSAMLLIVWAAISLLWTPYLADAQEHIAKLAGTLALAALACCALPRKTRIADFYLFALGLAAAAVVLASLFLRGMLPAGADADTSLSERAVTSLVLLLWPSVGALGVKQRWTLAIGLCIAVAAAAIIVWSPFALIALAAGGFAFAAGRSDLAASTRILAVIFALLFLAAPMLPQLAKFALAAKTPQLQGAWQPLAAWAAIVKADGLRLMTGHGLDAASRGIIAGYLPAATPRSVLFEIWFDLGIVGAAAAAALAAFGFLRAQRSGPVAGASISAAITSGLTIAIIGQGTTQIWWVTLSGIAAIACAGIVRAQHQTIRPRAQLQRGGAQRPGAEPV